ncbi:hypothetical protein ACFYN0_00940 [Streptomyces sp. NPDC006704]|uniref:hypothetical protein n=1 Tax=Streptomyces sp. NPDC006704 TaxID=3364760 RepID=UPI0036C35D64
MGGDYTAQQWEESRRRADQFRGLDGREHELLALIYYLCAAVDGREVEGITPMEVRRHLTDLDSLHQRLDQLLPGPAPDPFRTPADDVRQRIRRLQAEHGGEDGEFTGPGPVTGRIWGIWDSLQSPHTVALEDELPSDMIGEAFSNQTRMTGKTLFQHAADVLIRRLDQMLLHAAGSPAVSSEVLVTAGVHTGRTGRIKGVTWDVDGPPDVAAAKSFQITFDGLRGPCAPVDLAPGEFEELPKWDRRFAVVHAGEHLPTEWGASVLLATSGSTAWHQEALDILRANKGVFHRLVVLIPQPPDGDLLTDKHADWVTKAAAIADEIITQVPGADNEPPMLAPGFPANPHDHAQRLISFPDTSGSALPAGAWSEHAVLVPDAAAATRTALTRIGDGFGRKFGERDVPLLVARTGGFFDWLFAAREHGKQLVSAHVEWAYRDGTGEGRATMWAVHAHIEDDDLRVTDELVLGHATRLSVVAYLPRAVWTDTEIVLIEDDTSIVNRVSSLNSLRTPLRLPTMDLGLIRTGGGAERAQLVVTGELGLDVAANRLHPRETRHDTSLIASAHNIVDLRLTEEELDALRAGTTNDPSREPGPVAHCSIHRVADLLANPVTDWATLGIVTRAVLPTTLPISGDFRPPSS